MSQTEARLRTLRQAVVAFRSTPGRRGRCVTLGDAEDVLVAGDMHGAVENFRALFTLADLDANPRRHLVVQELVHGPHRYPAGGDKSHQLVDLVCALKVKYPARVHYLVGNHELAQLTGRRVLKAEGNLNELFARGVETAYGEAAADFVALYNDLFRSLPFAVRTANRVLMCHSLPSTTNLAAFDPADLDPDRTPDTALTSGGSLFSLVWGRDTEPDHVAAFLARMDADYLITGHIPCDAGFEVTSPRHVILDTQGSPAAYALVPAEGDLAEGDLARYVHVM